MKNNNFAKYITSFFIDYLSNERGVSHNTIRSYSNTFMQLLNYIDESKHIKAENIKLTNIDKKTILGFLDWIQDVKHCSSSTRNQRLGAILSFCRYMQYEDVIHIQQWQDILSIKIKKADRPTINYLSVEGVKLILEQVPINTRIGRRDLAMIALLYDSGARVQEIIDLTVNDLHLIKPCYITLYGKGRKKRLVPLHDNQVKILKMYISENMLDNLSANHKPLFTNKQGHKLSSAGVTFILNRYCSNARIINSDIIPVKITPHSLRHSKAMHLLQSGVNLVYIRDILGHVSIQTTEIYARADSKQKREALEAAYIDIIPGVDTVKSWEKDSKLKAWLKNLGK
ncbi:MAG: tyrosine-type recombinase/integrase [bacterium]